MQFEKVAVFVTIHIFYWIIITKFRQIGIFFLNLSISLDGAINKKRQWFDVRKFSHKNITILFPRRIGNKTYFNPTNKPLNPTRARTPFFYTFHRANLSHAFMHSSIDLSTISHYLFAIDTSSDAFIDDFPRGSSASHNLEKTIEPRLYQRARNTHTFEYSRSCVKSSKHFRLGGCMWVSSSGGSKTRTRLLSTCRIAETPLCPGFYVIGVFWWLSFLFGIELLCFHVNGWLEIFSVFDLW